MPRFSYTGTDRSGRKSKGSIEAVHEAEARAKLRFLGIQGVSVQVGGIGSSESGSRWRPITIDKKGNISFQLSPPGVSFKEITIFTRQFSVLINAGVSVIQCLEMLSKQSENPYFREVIASVQRNIQSGSDLADALAKQPHVFSDLYCSLVRAGTASGALDKMLEKLSIYLERANKMRRQLISAVSYPATVVVVAVVLLLFELFFVVPMFQEYFEDAGQELPEFTLLVIGASNLLVDNAVVFFLSLGGAIFGISRYASTPKGREEIDRISLKIPIFGKVLTKIALARFSTTMATLIAGGVGLIETLEVCARATGNLKLEKDVLKIRSDVSGGQSIADSMDKHPVIPSMMSGMVRVGEASGQLDQMFTKISQFYEDEVDTVMSQVLKLMEPMLFVILGAVVGVVLIAMYLPIFDLANTQTGGDM